MAKDFTVDRSILEDLFREAFNKDEFEFCCNLLRVRGLESPGWDALEESTEFIHQIISLINGPLDNTFKFRMTLLLYCHITEMNDFYNIVANFLWILLGERYSIDPFWYSLYSDRKTINSPEGKVNRIKELSIKANKPTVGDLYEFLLVKQIRNAFFHADYTLYDQTFRIVSGEGINFEGVVTKEIPLEWLIRRMEAAINTQLQIIDLMYYYRSSYRENKIIKARISPELCDVKLLVNDKGLFGFSA